MADEHEIIISADGAELRHLHDDNVTAMTAEVGDQTIRRASHVEPTAELSPKTIERVWDRDHPGGLPEGDETGPDDVIPPNKWWADMAPVGGPVLGPFDGRQQALDEEVAWLRANNIPACRECGENDGNNDSTH